MIRSTIPFDCAYCGLENLPAPCKYDKPSCFDYKPPVTTIVKPFISRKPRFEESKERENSFHAMYDTVISMGNIPTPSVKEIPFSLAAERFQRKKKSDSDPEPNLYLPKGFCDRVVEKNSKPYALFRPPFDSTVGREINFVPFDSHLRPDCALYPREKPPPQYKVDHGSSVFVSQTERHKMNLTKVSLIIFYERYLKVQEFNLVTRKEICNEK
ncbi:hypothetical protein HHI36_004501 [Cryptolaemus montrouzieri]|uniref:Uncharacterized protein n=1 Tax=Cryptolaemus montrouzieri TaxID=559131 RepID=A0ABD2NRV0_9CUCU